MARGDSTIKVTFLGDVKNLTGAIGKVDAATAGVGKSAIKVVGTGIAVKKGFDLLNDSLAEADRRGDAITRLEDKLGDLATPLIKTSDGFATIGASSQDMLELEATYADLATSAGVAAPEIAATAEGLALSALAAAQVHDADPSAIIEAIGKAVGGQTRGIKDYGIDLTEAAVQQRAMRDTGKDLPSQLTDTELAAARTSLIMEGFAGIVGDVTTGTADLEIKQDELGAKFETVAGKVGAAFEGPLTDVLTWVNDMIDAIPGAIEGWQMLGAAIEDFAGEVLTPLARVADALREIISLFDNGQRAFQVSQGRTPRGSPGSGSSDREISDAQRRQQERNGLGT